MISKSEEKEESFWTNVGEGLGCFLILLGLGIFLYMPQLIELLGKAIGK